MKTFQLNCGNCGAGLALPLREPSGHTACPSCRAHTQVEAFPALLRPTRRGRAGEALIVDDESSCYYHPGKKAVVPCDGCGRFLCALCDVEFEGRHLCPACVEAGVNKGKLQAPGHGSVYYDAIALALAVFPLLLFWITPITAPIALFVAVRYWNTPMSIFPRSKWRFVAAIVLASLQLLGWGVLLMVLVGAWVS